MKMLIAILVLLLSGCATRGTLRTMPEQAGEVVLFAAELREAALAARNAVVATPLKIVEADHRGSSSWYLIARGPSTELVRVLCEQVDGETVAIRIVQRRFDVFVDADDWAPTLFSQLRLELQVVQAGSPDLGVAPIS